jgi:phosphoadenosine phosphosulfate reductase
VPDEAERWTAEEVLSWGFARVHPRMAIASAFGAEDIVLIGLASRVRPDFRVFTVDTDFLFPETDELMEKIEGRYDVGVERCRPAITPQEQDRAHGPALWTRNPDYCCGLRKVQPLGSKLPELEAWVTAIRLEQTPARTHAQKIEWEARFGLVKLNPLADWSWAQVWEHIRAHGLPYNPLHDGNYPSIGCTHCTLPIKSGEDLRAGRWPGFRKVECGLHMKGGSDAPIGREFGDHPPARKAAPTER